VQSVATTEVSAVVDAPVEDVWRVFGDFGAMPNCLTAVVDCQLEDGAVGRGPVGAVRAITLRSGAVARERLLGHDEVRRRVSYEIVGASRFPVRSYYVQAGAWAVTSTGQTFVRLAVDFDADAADEPVAAEMITATYDVLLRDLAAHVTRTPASS
jgi:hypothetical protein